MIDKNLFFNCPTDDCDCPYWDWIRRAPGEVAPCDEEEEYIPNDYYGDECNGICDLCPESDICALR